MAFESLSKIAKEARRPGGAGSRKSKSIVAVTQAFNKKTKYTTLTFRISREGMSGGRFKEGDRADISYDKENSLWMIKAIPAPNNRDGYAISWNDKSYFGQIRLTHYPEMPSINKDLKQKTKGYSNDEKIKYALGEIVFSIDKTEIIDDKKTKEEVSE